MFRFAIVFALLTFLSYTFFFLPAPKSSPLTSVNAQVSFDNPVGPRIPTPNYNESNCQIVVGPTNQYKTIQSAINAAPSGNLVYTICVRNGTYREKVNINKNNIHLVGESAENTIIDGEFKLPSGSPQGPFPKGYDLNKYPCFEDQAKAELPQYSRVPYRACSVFSGLVDITADNVIFEGFKVFRSRGRGVRVFKNGGIVNEVILRNLRVDYTRKTSIYLYGFRNTTLSFTHLSRGASHAPYIRSSSDLNHGASGIGMQGADNFMIANNEVHDGWGEGIIGDGTQGGSEKVTIQDNEIYDNWKSTYMHGIENVLIQRNLIYTSKEGTGKGFAQVRLYLAPGEPHFARQSNNIIVINNIFASHSSGTFRISSGAQAGSDRQVKNIQVLNNTFYSQGGDQTIYLSGNIYNIDFTNNVVVNKSGTPTSNMPSGNAATQISASYNCYSDQSFGSLRGANSIYNCNPQFEGVNGSGQIPELRSGQVDTAWFRLKAESPVIDKGADLSGSSITWNNNDNYVVDDYWIGERPYGSAYDIGAHEFGSTPGKGDGGDGGGSGGGGLAWNYTLQDLVRVFEADSLETTERKWFSFSDFAQPVPPSPTEQAVYCDAAGQPSSTAVIGNERLYTALGCIPIGTSQAFIGFVLSIGLGIGGGITFLLVIYAAYKVMTSNGDPQKLQAGKDLLTASISGLALIIFSVLILRVIGSEILRLPGL